MSLPFSRPRRQTLPPLARPAKLLLGLLAASAEAQDSPSPSAAEIDWVPLEELSEEQRALVPEACCGLYLAPELQPQTGAPGTILFNANDLDGDFEGGVITLQGPLTIRQDETLLQGDVGVYDRETQRYSLEGNVRIRQPGVLIAGESAAVDRANRNSRIENASYVLHEQHARGSAEVIVYTDEDGIVTIDNGLFSRCEPGDSSWALRGDEIRLDREAGRGLARNVTLRVADVPVFYLPLISFPINDERATGFLAPIIGSTREGGLDLAAPYYLNLAPNYDMTLTPRLLSDRGLMLGVEGRYLGQRSNNLVNFAWMPEDRLYDSVEASLPGSDSPPQSQRWLLELEHSGSFLPRTLSYVDYAAVSDEDYFQDLGGSGLSLTTQSFLPRAAGLRYFGQNWRVDGSMLGYQIIDPSVAEIHQPYDRLPRVTVDGDFAWGRHLEYGLRSEYVYFHRDLNTAKLDPSDIANGALVTGQRLSVEPEVSLPFSSPGAFVRPSARYRYAAYSLGDQQPGAPSDPSRGIFQGSVDSGLIFERDVERTGYSQTLEPRLFYLYSEYEDQSDIPVFDSSPMTFSFNQLFRQDRFSGQDRVGDANQLTLALTTRLLDSRGQERGHASVGQIRYFEDRRVTLDGLPGETERSSGSAVAGEFSWSVKEDWRAFSYLEWNNTDRTLDVGSFHIRYQSDINRILNIGYRYRDVPNRLTPQGFDRRIDQIDLSGVWPVRDDLNLVFRWYYDRANGRDLETILGVEYSNCCWDMRLIARRWIDNNALFDGLEEDNSGIFLQFELKGLGSVLGGNVSGILSNGITGYRERDFQ